jgi:hypothetical protein
MPPHLGLDIGRVIIGGGAPGSGEDTSFFEGSMDDALRTPPVDGAFDAIPSLVQLFAGRVWLISKCGPRTEERTRQWLSHHRFFDRTGIPPANARFCRRREDKAEHCAELAVTHFIDDRPDVLAILRPTVGHRFLFGPQDAPPSAGVTSIPSWDQAEAIVAATLTT